MSRWLAPLLLVASSVRGESIAIIGAHVWTNTADAPVRNATIVISGGRIVSIQSAQPPPPSAHVFEAAGRVVAMARYASIFLGRIDSLIQPLLAREAP